LTAVTFAEQTYFSHPDPGIQYWMKEADSGFMSMQTCSKPDAERRDAKSLGSGAPATQQARAWGRKVGGRRSGENGEGRDASAVGDKAAGGSRLRGDMRRDGTGPRIGEFSSTG
jgi:hypothetical protein